MLVNINDRVLRSAYASKIAYTRPANMKRMHPIHKRLHGDSSPWSSEIHSEKGAHVYLWKSGDKSYVIAFKGSSTLTDLCTFMDFRKTSFHFRDKHVHVHSGVLNMFASVEPTLTELIKDSNFLTFCGHSLGGSLAIFAAAYYSHLFNNNIDITCHTFGASRVGDDLFRKWYSEGVQDSLNLTTKYDIVPWIPFSMEPMEDRLNMEYGNILPNPFVYHDLDTYIDFIKQYHEIKKFLD